MRTVKIYGWSDDLIEVEGCEGGDEFSSYQRGPIMWRGDLIAPGGREAMKIRAIFDDDGDCCWSFAIGQAIEGIACPSWPVRITQHPDSENSVLLEIDVPDGTKLLNVWPVRGES